MFSFIDESWKQINPLLFIRADGERAGLQLAFKENKQGEIAYIIRDMLRMSEKVVPQTGKLRRGGSGCVVKTPARRMSRLMQK